MSDIEHWVCLNCDGVDGLHDPDDDSLCWGCRCHGEHGEIVQLVPADQLKGAVKRVETAEAEVERLRGLLEAQGRSWKQKLAAVEKKLATGGG